MPDTSETRQTSGSIGGRSVGVSSAPKAPRMSTLTSIADLGGERSEAGGVLERTKRQSDVQAERMQDAARLIANPGQRIQQVGEQVMELLKPPQDTAGRVYKNIIDATAAGGDEQRSGRLDFCEAFGESVIDNECVGRVLDE